MASANSQKATTDSSLRKRSNQTKAEPSEKATEIVEAEDVSKVKDAKSSSPSALLRLESVIMPIIFTLCAIFIRTYRIGVNNHVVWDEAHFGKFGTYYINHTFYHDVHPPLGKMLVGFSGYIAGYNGSFDFQSGAEYPAHVPYVQMRIFNSAFSIVCVPLAYFTAKAIGFSLPVVWIFTCMVLFENTYATLGRFILLDSMLLCFTVASYFCFVKYHNERNRPFSFNWWKWMALTGVSLGCTVSVKMVGLFVISLVGIYTVVDLWNFLADKRMSWKTYAMHWIARIICLIIIPLSIYMFAFYLHFHFLYKSGPGDATMPSLFQARLEGSEVGLGPRNVALGSSIITLRNQGMHGSLLHSHIQTYPEGSGQQQITGYGYIDENNDWFFDRVREKPFWTTNETNVEFVADGYEYRLVHKSTGRNLHSHEVVAPLDKKAFEASCYGNATAGDAKDYWVVEIVKQLGKEDKSTIHPLTTSFRLRHSILGCYLAETGSSLPEWGFRQKEIACIPNLSKKDKRGWWNIETHENERLPPRPKSFRYPKTGFLHDFIFLNKANMATNNALVPESDKLDPLASRAWQWPTLNVGLRICGWGDANIRYYLMGTPFTTWGSSAAVIGLMIFVVILLLRWQRQYSDLTRADSLNLFLMGGFYPLLGWGLHFAPFVIMARVTYVHHYLPALYFALIIFCYCIDTLLSLLPKTGTGRAIKTLLYVFFGAGTIGCFWWFRGMSFGMEGPLKDYNYLEWLPGWKMGE